MKDNQKVNWFEKLKVNFTIAANKIKSAITTLCLRAVTILALFFLYLRRKIRKNTPKNNIVTEIYKEDDDASNLPN